MKTKAVIHVDLEDPSRLQTALGNIENFLDEISPAESDLRVVVHSSAVRMLRKGKACNHEKKIFDLAKKGVRFLACNNSLLKSNIDPAELLPVIEVVPAGIVELVRLQHEGFAYVKP
ncbi:MAG: DsrE family protein [Desulfobacterales bacterium]|nr:DsrE family protein [Desulfobacterales bacterium]